MRFRTARRDPELTVVEGFHALKHALRFGAELVEAVAVDPAAWRRLARGAGAPTWRDSWAPGRDGRHGDARRPGAAGAAHRRRRDRPPPAGRRRRGARRPGAGAPVVLLEQPKNMGNIGACIRVAAGAGAAAVLTTGENDPWHPDAVRGAAGLQFALPVASVEVAARERPAAAGDRPGGGGAGAGAPAGRAVLAFGTERHGLSAELLERADARVAIPMRDGVSSLNLATSVAIVLFCQRLG